MENVTAKVSGGAQGPGRQGRERHAQEDADAARAGVRGGQQARQVRAAEVRERRPVPGRPVLALQVPPLRRRAPGVRARARHRRLRRRSGQLPVPALVPRHVGAARLRPGRQAGRHAELPAASTAPVPRPATWCSSPATRATTDRLLTVAQLRDAAQRRPAALAAARLGAARPLHPVRQDQRRGGPHHRGPAQHPREQHQGAARAARRAAR